MGSEVGDSSVCDISFCNTFKESAINAMAASSLSLTRALTPSLFSWTACCKSMHMTAMMSGDLKYSAFDRFVRCSVDDGLSLELCLELVGGKSSNDFQ